MRVYADFGAIRHVHDKVQRRMMAILSGVAQYPGADPAMFARRRASSAEIECRAAGLWSDRAVRLVLS